MDALGLGLKSYGIASQFRDAMFGREERKQGANASGTSAQIVGGISFATHTHLGNVMLRYSEASGPFARVGQMLRSTSAQHDDSSIPVFRLVEDCGPPTSLIFESSV